MCVAVVVLILVLLGIIAVLLLRYRRRRRHKRRLLRQQNALAGGAADHDDDAFHPYIVDDAVTHKLSCAAQDAGGGAPTSPNRPSSYALSTLDNVMPGGGVRREASVDNVARACDYGSNADQLENVGRQPDGGSHSPEFVGRSPAVAAKRFMTPATGDGEASSRGLNNLNKAENYRKKSECPVRYLPSEKYS